MKLSQVRKILIVKLCCIGDVMFTTPLLRTLRKGFPEANLTYLVGEWSKQVIETNPHLNQTIIYNVPFEKSNWLIKIIKTLRFILKIRKEKFDLAINCHRSLSSSLFLFLSGIRYRVGFNWHHQGFALAKKIPFDYTKYEVERYLDIARGLNLTPQDNYLEIGLKKEEREFAEELLKKLNLSENKLISVFPGGGKNPKTVMLSKKWIPERFARLSDWISEKYKAKIIFLGGESDKKIIQEIISQMKTQPINLAGKLTFRESAAAIEKSHLFIGGDSGLLYLAAAVGTPTIGLFGPSDPRLVAPRGQKHIFIWKKIECSPCYVPQTVHKKEFLKCKDFKCMEKITLDEVKNAVDSHWDKFAK
ncbi:MAG: lipopolysaccharide heptosyltransferase II [Candidatus Aminicenantia bacterium]